MEKRIGMPEAVFQGHNDIPLNDKGIAQAIDLKESLSKIPFTAALSSDLSRARQTAELILQSRLPSLNHLLCVKEMLGALQGEKAEVLDELMRPFFLSPQAQTKENYLNAAWHPELETASAVYRRVTDFLHPYAHLHSGQTILVVSHGGVLRSLLDHLSYIPGERWAVSNCGFIKLRIDPHNLHLLIFMH